MQWFKRRTAKKVENLNSDQEDDEDILERTKSRRIKLSWKFQKTKLKDRGQHRPTPLDRRDRKTFGSPQKVQKVSEFQDRRCRNSMAMIHTPVAIALSVALIQTAKGATMAQRQLTGHRSRNGVFILKLILSYLPVHLISPTLNLPDTHIKHFSHSPSGKHPCCLLRTSGTYQPAAQTQVPHTPTLQFSNRQLW